MRRLWMPLGFLTLMVLLAVLEMSSNFVEKGLGSYLNRRNRGREAWGRSWEEQRRTHEAAKKLDEEVVEAGKLRARAELVTSFGELLSVIPENQGIPITPAKFVELYLTLPVTIRKALIEPSQLVDLYRGDNWVRTSVWKKGDRATIYFVDNRNRIMMNMTVSEALTEAAVVHGQTTSGSLNDNPSFKGNIHSADRFFSSFQRLSPSEREDIISDPDILLELPKPVIRVGLGSFAGSTEYSIIGFESSDNRVSSVTVYPVLSSSLSRLKWMLAWEDSDTLFTNDETTDTLTNDDDAPPLEEESP